MIAQHDIAEVFAAEPVRWVGEIPSFVPDENYAGNFGKQWRRFRDCQLDSRNGTSISREFMERLLGHPVSQLAGLSVLEVGAGAGRFTEHFVRHAESVVAVDLSEAIFVNAALGSPNLVAAQVDLFRMPPLRRKFDLVYCRGVLQHTPDPPRAIGLLHQWARPGGRVVFDIYAPMRLGRWDAKYLLRPLIQRAFSYESFSAFLDRNAEGMLRARWRLKPLLPGKSKRILDYLLPVWDYRGVLPLSESQLVEWARLDTLDAMFAHYDNPMKYEDVLALLGRLPCELVAGDRGLNAFSTQVLATVAGGQS